MIDRKLYIKQIYKKNKINFALTLFLCLVEVALQLVLSIFLKYVIDIATNGTLNDVLDALYLLVVSLVAFIAYSVANVNIKNNYVKRALSQYKKLAYKNIQKLSISNFNKREVSTYISSLTNDVTYLESNYISNTFSLITNVAALVGALTLMFINNYLLTLVAIGLTLLPLVFALIFGGRLVKENEKLSKENERFMHFVKDSLSGFSTVKSFKVEKKINELFEEKNKDLENTRRKRNKSTMTLEAIGAITGILAQLGVFLFGAYLCVTTEDVTVGVITLFVQLMNMVIGPITQIPQLISVRKASLPLIDKIVTYTNDNNVIVGKEDVTYNVSLSLQHVNFKYSENYILNDINLDFEKGKSYAIVGTSGSGKTTLLNLIMGRYLSYEGTICFDHKDIKTLNIDSLYDHVSLIEQSVFIFDDSIINNITMYNKVDSTVLNSIIEQSGLKSLIEEKGPQFRCGENGKNLSGGERQRISIARGLLKKAEVLLLDEITSALDTKTSEQIINEVLNYQDVTKIFVLHTLKQSTLSQIDEIIVLNNGTVFEKGSFDELMSQDGLFKTLYNIGKY